jgi:hypothetical protein
MSWERFSHLGFTHYKKWEECVHGLKICRSWGERMGRNVCMYQIWFSKFHDPWLYIKNGCLGFLKPIGYLCAFLINCPTWVYQGHVILYHNLAIWFWQATIDQMICLWHNIRQKPNVGVKLAGRLVVFSQFFCQWTHRKNMEH